MKGPTKICRGPAHPQPVNLPLEDFGRNGDYLQSQCTLCRRWPQLQTKEGPHGFVPTQPLLSFVRELIDRCGSLDAGELRTGVDRQTLLRITNGKTLQMRRLTAERILLGLSEQRKLDRLNGASVRFLEARKAQARIEERMERDGCV